MLVSTIDKFAMEIFLIPVGVGIILGIILAVRKVAKKRDAEKEGDMHSFSNLINNQFVVGNNFKGTDLTVWFRENTPVNCQTAYFLAKPTEAVAEMFMLHNIPADLDRNTNLIQAVVDTARMEAIALRMVSFQLLPAELEAQFAGKDYVVYTAD